jgi:FkbM family methyltransferase
LEFNVRANPGLPITIIPKALSDEAGVVAVELDRRDRGGTRTKKIEQAGASAGTVHVPSQTLLDVLAGEGVDAVDALKIDVEGLEDVILAPFFHDAPPQLRPRLVIIEDSRSSWKVDLMSVMRGCGYELVALSRHKNLMLRLKP